MTIVNQSYSMKICSTCKLSKSLDEFCKDSRQKDGRHCLCRVCNRAKVAAWQKTPNGAAKHASNSNRYQTAPKTKAKHARAVTQWQQSERGKAKRRSIWASYYTSKLHSMPPWLTEIQLSEIEQFYILAKELQWLSDKPLEVDHIVPLQGKNVSGLHVPWNLQILPQNLNRRKNNKFNPKNTF